MKYLKLIVAVMVLLLIVPPVSAKKKKGMPEEITVKAPVREKKKKGAKAPKELKAKEPKKLKPVYMYGVSASFTDSVVYHTNIQFVDSVHPDGHGFLPQRELYSYQLKNYLEYDKKTPNRTCMVYFSSNKKKLEKQYAKLMAKYKKSQGVVLQAVEPEEFHFKKPEF